MRRGGNLAPGSHQLFDQTAETTVSIAASTAGGSDIGGTVWPLLPNQAYRLFNIGLNCLPDTPGVVTCQDLAIYIEFLDGGNNPTAFMYLVAEGFASGALMGGVEGFNIAKEGDPLMEFFSGMNLVGAPLGGPPSFFQVRFGGDFTNTDAVNPHNVVLAGSALFSAAPL